MCENLRVCDGSRGRANPAQDRKDTLYIYLVRITNPPSTDPYESEGQKSYLHPVNKSPEAHF